MVIDHEFLGVSETLHIMSIYLIFLPNLKLLLRYSRLANHALHFAFWMFLCALGYAYAHIVFLSLISYNAA